MNEIIPTPKRKVAHHRAMLLAARPIPVPSLIAVVAALLMLAVQRGQAGSATWLAVPDNNRWNNVNNWTAGGPPNGPSDVATFNTSNITSLLHTADVEVSGITFHSGASAFDITTGAATTMTISGVGVTDNAAAAESFVAAGSSVANSAGGQIIFNNSATAGSVTFTTHAGTVANAGGGSIQFNGNTTAASASITNDGATTGPMADPTANGTTYFYGTATAGSAHITDQAGSSGTGQAFFHDNSTAGNSIITNQAGPGSSYGGQTVFYDNSTAGNAVITNNAATVSGSNGGFTEIGGDAESASAGNATFINNGSTGSGESGGSTYCYGPLANATFIANGATTTYGGGFILFFGNSVSTCRVEVFGNGELETLPAPITIGSLEGDGNVFLGNQLSIGSRNTSTTFSGVIDELSEYAGQPVMGSIIKVGSGTLSLTNANNYSGGTTVSAGTLLASHNGALGAGNVSVASGATLQVQNGTAHNYIFDGATLSIVTNSIVNLNYTGTPDVVGFLVLNGVSQVPGVWGSAASGAPHQLSQFTGSGTILVTTSAAVSQKVQGAGTFDIPLPFTGPSGIECRSGGANNNYQIVVTFGSAVTFASASVTSGTGMVLSTSGNGTSSITINVTGVTNAQRLVVTVFSVNYGPATGDLPIRVGMLLGDTNANSTVNAADVSQTKSRLGQTVNATNFRSDVNANGSINAADTAIIKQKSGTSLPP